VVVGAVKDGAIHALADRYTSARSIPGAPAPNRTESGRGQHDRSRRPASVPR